VFALLVVAGLMGFVLLPRARSDYEAFVARSSSEGPLDGRPDGAPGETAKDPLMQTREFRFEYRVEIPMPSPSAGPIHVFVPIAADTKAQKILQLEIETGLQGRIETEAVYGNRFWHGVIEADRTETASVDLRYIVSRSVLRAGDVPEAGAAVRRFLAPNERVVVAHPVLEPILREIHSASKGAGKPARARAIYDWIVDNVEYKKVGSGWGNGDTFWACTERYGNCTDFHSLFISLARTEGIPARFEMGFSIPLDREEGWVSGYHCWVEFWLPEVGWFPIDASEAFKHPEKRELFYGTQPADRVHFTTGRDLRLGPDHLDRPLNYFIYPYLEVAGRSYDLEIKTQFRYREVEARVVSTSPQLGW
jgi:transglutaminase-like putative cysteine protease